MFAPCIQLPSEQAAIDRSCAIVSACLPCVPCVLLPPPPPRCVRCLVRVFASATSKPATAPFIYRRLSFLNPSPSLVHLHRRAISLLRVHSSSSSSLLLLLVYLYCVSIVHRSMPEFSNSVVQLLLLLPPLLLLLQGIYIYIFLYTNWI